MEVKSSPVSATDLSKGCKDLKSMASESKSGSMLDYDKTIAQQYAKMYEDLNGDITKIFEKLNENPRKALKYPPMCADEFGEKYAQGFYTCVSGSEAK